MSELSILAGFGLVFFGLYKAYQFVTGLTEDAYKKGREDANLAFNADIEAACEAAKTRLFIAPRFWMADGQIADLAAMCRAILDAKGKKNVPVHYYVRGGRDWQGKTFSHIRTADAFWEKFTSDQIAAEEFDRENSINARNLAMEQAQNLGNRSALTPEQIAKLHQRQESITYAGQRMGHPGDWTLVGR